VGEEGGEGMTENVGGPADDVADDLADDAGFPGWPPDPADVPHGSFLDLPYEAGSADPQDIQYADLGDDYKYDPEQDWRDAQAQTANRMFGEFSPRAMDAEAVGGEPGSEQATDG
jgi:hypothetical protein